MDLHRSRKFEKDRATIHGAAVGVGWKCHGKCVYQGLIIRRCETLCLAQDCLYVDNGVDGDISHSDSPAVSGEGIDDPGCHAWRFVSWRAVDHLEARDWLGIAHGVINRHRDKRSVPNAADIV